MIPQYTPDVARLKAWRPTLRGDPATHDIMAFYSAAIGVLRRNPTIVEIGVAHGRSLLWAAAELVQFGHTEAALYAVDPWRFTAGPPTGHSSMIFKHALMSLIQHGSASELQLVHLVRVPSLRAAALFDRTQLDCVMIDGDHSEDACAADIDWWLPLIRAGGILAGHDLTDEWPGVRRAVEGAFGQRYEVRGTVWAVQL